MSQQINLFNPVFRKPEFSFASAQTMLYGVGMVILLSGLYAAYLGYRLSVVQREAQTLAQQYQEATTRRDELLAAQAQHKPDAQLAAEIATLEAKLTARQQIVEILKSGAIGTTAGFSEYMRAFSRQTVNGLWLTGFDIGSDNFVLEGRTLSPDLLPSYLQRLNQEPALEGKQFAALRISRPKVEADMTPIATGVAPQPAAESPKNGNDKTGESKQSAPLFLEFSISTSEGEITGTQNNTSALPQMPNNANAAVAQ
jgi:uncharacterized membrane protein YciS (DUF1049 family)